MNFWKGVLKLSMQNFSRCAFLVILGYMLGSLNSALILTYILRRKDIRSFGDGNAGTTNVFEHINKLLGLIVFLLDFLKGMFPYFISSQMGISNINCIALSMSSVILGHDFPLFFGFKGGTGIAALLGGVTAINPNLGITIFIFFLVVFVFVNLLKINIFGFNCLEESEAMSFIFAIYLIYRSNNFLLKAYFALSLLVILFKHRKRILSIFETKKVLKS